MTASHDIYRAEQIPVFQNMMFDTSEKARNCPKGDITLVQDRQTGLVFNRTFRPDVMSYGPDYQNEQAHSAVFQNHLNEVAAIIGRHFSSTPLVEIGCGKGRFLEQLQTAGFSITGCDPVYEGDNPAIIRELFTSSLGLVSDGIILRHVLEHIPDPVGFLSSVKKTNRDRGKIYMEVPCLDWILDHRAWFDIVYEHVNYFRLADFSGMFETVYESGSVFGGQYLYVVADLATLITPQYRAESRVELPPGFTAAIERHAGKARTAKAEGYAVWGAAAKGVMFSLFMERAGTPAGIVIDINPAKQGKFTAGTGLPVHSPEEALDELRPGTDVYVMNSNYLSEIRLQSHNQFNYIEVDHDVI